MIASAAPIKPSSVTQTIPMPRLFCGVSDTTSPLVALSVEVALVAGILVVGLAEDAPQRPRLGEDVEDLGDRARREEQQRVGAQAGGAQRRAT